MLNTKKIINNILTPSSPELFLKKVVSKIIQKKKLKQRQLIKQDLKEYLKGTLENYNYWSGSLSLLSVRTIREALKLGLRVLRENVKTKEIEKFNYYTEKFEII